MQKNISVWNKLFVAFVMLWTVFAIFIFYGTFHDISSDWDKIETKAVEKSTDSEEQRLDHSVAHALMKEEKSKARILFLELWVLPLVLVYCLGQIAGWTVKGYLKKEEAG
ncbi:MAG: hypothetical protein HN402_11680 [Candidatus Scalindua sp.]|jgi:predicted membrane protein|nr:hypothetical protein [Candidatus Scalindua sp.]